MIALIILRKHEVILPTLAELSLKCINSIKNDWKCVIDLGFSVYNYHIPCNLLVRRVEPNILDFSKRLSKTEGKCDSFIIATFGDRYHIYGDFILNTYGISHQCNHYGDLLDTDDFIQKESFVYSDGSSELSLNKNLHIHVRGPVGQSEIDDYNNSR